MYRISGRKSLRKRKTVDFALLATSGQESFEAWDDNVSLEDARRNVQLTSELEDSLNADELRPDELVRWVAFGCSVWYGSM